MACKWCKTERGNYQFGFCEDCYKELKCSYKETKSRLQAIKADTILAENDQKQTLLSEALNLEDILKTYIKAGFPISKKDISALIDDIKRNCGVKVRGKFFDVKSICLLCIIAALAGVSFYLNSNMTTLSRKYQKLQSDYEYQESKIIGLNSQIEELTASSKSSAPIKRNYTFENGNFVAGEDFPSGSYDITALSGFGNVIGGNTLDGGINAIMGTKSDDTLGIAEQKYSNIYFSEGTTLTIDGVKIRMVLQD